MRIAVRRALAVLPLALWAVIAGADTGPAPPDRRDVVIDLLKIPPFDDGDGIRLGEGRDSAEPVLGGFNTGFRIREDGALDGTGEEAELRVFLRPGVAYRVAVDVTPRRTSALALFANGRWLGRASLRGGREQVSFDLPADLVRDGDNFLTFELRGRRRVRGRLSRGRRILKKPLPEKVRATFHRIDVVPATPPAERSFSVIALVPRGAELRARHAGPGRAEIRVEVAGSAPLAARPGGEGDLRADLGPLAGKAARFSFTAEGEGAWKEAVLTAPAPEALPAPPRARNIVLWVVDTLRADKLGCYNPKTRVRTPNFDGFARQGVLFRKAIAQSSHSKPATATILTGHYPASHGGNAHRDRLRAGVPLISELFQRAGYETAVFAGNGFIGKPHGFGRGWNTFRNLLREGKPAKTPYLFPHVRRWLQRKREKPFFLYVHTVDPHVPYNPPKHFLALYWQGRYLGPLIPRRSGHQLDDARAGKFRVGPIDRKYAEALYDGEVSVADYWFGKFLDALEEAGLAKETLLAVTADHGEEFWERGNPGHGHTLYNELVRVPFLLGPAPLTPAGRVVEADVEMVDLAPTLLEMAGVSVPSEMQGRSLVPLVRAEPPVPAPAFSIHEDRIAAAQAGPWKYIIYRGGQEHLFDLGADPAEKHDVLAREPLVRRWLRGLLARWLHLQGTWRKSRQGILGQPR